MPGPLTGFRVIELGGIGPAPFCGMVLSDMGADVVRVDRAAAVAADGAPQGVDVLSAGILSRGRRSVAINLKHPDGLATALTLTDQADAVIEGFRPGVVERLGIGPDVCLARNPRLVYGRITGWGQGGPLAQAAGHDLNYLALAGGLAPIGRRDSPPCPPLNLVADFGGGGLLLATGVLAGLLEAGRSGQGQVVDAAMLDGAAYLMTMMFELLGRGAWVEERESNANDGGAPFYAVYETADGEYVAIGAMEPQFYRLLLDRLDLEENDLPEQWDRTQWPATKQRLAEVFRQRTQKEWCELLEGSDACFSPVLRMSEAPQHPHNVARRSFEVVDGVVQPAPAPRFTRTPSGVAGGAPGPGEHTDSVLAAYGLTPARVAELRRSGAVA
ncbi:MAG TPA: CaiB/BaiF CoA-transferase family protein [Acidimicrobiia bacterium]|nr:CaiB/BaiF CoA-transferase family protein [Acidimicrobiia bacterium]